MNGVAKRTMESRKHLASLLTLFILVSGSVFAQVDKFRPAQFGISESVFLEALRLIELSPNTVMDVRCSVTVATDGLLSEPVCSGGENATNAENNAAKAISAAAEGFRIEAARIDGEPVSVIYPFTVILQEANNALNLRLLNGHPPEHESRDRRYSSPQRLHDSALPTACYTELNSIGLLFTIGSALISAHGEVLEWDVGFDGEPECPDQIAEVFRRSQFIPAFRNGIPVSARYTELIISGGF